jgi:uncharacterized protein (DUF58 family)
MNQDRWIAVLVLILLIGLIFQLSLLIVVSCLLLIVFLGAGWWQKHALDGVIYRRKFHYYRMFPGETSDVRLEIQNNKLLPLPWLMIRDRWPRFVSPSEPYRDHYRELLRESHVVEFGILENVVSLLWFERVSRSYKLLFQKRGVYPVGPAHFTTTDLMGIYEVDAISENTPPSPDNAYRKNEGTVQRLVVFPQPEKLLPIKLPKENPFGSQKALKRLFEDPTQVMGIRQYHPEDEFRKVHWPATARTGQLQVKVYQPTAAPVLVVALNASTTERFWDGYLVEKLEKMVSLAASLCIQSIEDGYAVGLLSNSCLRLSDQPFRVPPGRSPQQLGQLLEALAAVTPLTSGKFAAILQKEMNKISFGAVLIIITAILMPDDIELARGLRKHERKVIIISLADQPELKIPGIEVLHYD